MKKGLSTIAITLITILVAFVAIGTLWLVVNSVLSESSDQISSWFMTDLSINNVFEQAGNLIVNITRNTGGEELARIRFILSDGKTSEIIEKESNLSKSESQRFSIHPSNLNSTEVETVSAVPIFKSRGGGGSESVGEATNIYYVNATNETTVEDCKPESQKETCGSSVCGNKTNNCEIEISCGTCSSGQTCEKETCVNVTQINFSISNNFNDQTWGTIFPAINDAYGVGTPNTAYAERAIVPDEKNSTNFVAQHIIRYGEKNFRAESMDNEKCANGFSEVVKIKILLPANYSADSSAEIISQWHDMLDYNDGELITRSPPLALATQGGVWGIQYWWDANFISTNISPRSETLNLGSYSGDLGKWVDWEFSIHWDYNEKGELVVKKDNVTVVNLENISLGYNDKVGNYFKFGVYKWDWKTKSTSVSERIIYHDDFSRECFI